MEIYSAKATIRESLDLGKNTAKNSGIAIEVFAKREEGKRGKKLGTIEIGRGSFAWWTRNRRKSGGKPSVDFSWDEFAAMMDGLARKDGK